MSRQITLLSQQELWKLQGSVCESNAARSDTIHLRTNNTASANVIDHILNPVVSLRNLSSRGCHSFSTASASLSCLRSTFYSYRRSAFSPPILLPPGSACDLPKGSHNQGDSSPSSGYTAPLPDGWKVLRALSNGGGASKLAQEVISRARSQKPARWPECSHKHQACRMEQPTVLELRLIYMSQGTRK